ncbi:unnamed protein product [Linum tenue]|uniref:Myb-like domain-containing protein n=1 Tax=Linum tenue TaxID=586396 RepID=A0AAV0NZH2_9ROSI|nr:unnamed protein product [Linum tenue]
MVLDEKVVLTSPITPPSSNGVDSPLAAAAAADDSSKTPRLPRWTRQEILVLIQGKKVAENRVRRGRAAGMGLSPLQLEPKWASVSSYCKKHGVNRGPVQCRKRWSNLAGDFKKIKEWESQLRDESDSFWVMRNDLRRERKLPGFFDREVYDILDGAAAAAAHVVSSSTSAVIAQPVPGLCLALAPAAADGEEADAVFDSGRSAAAEDRLFSDFEQEDDAAAAALSPEKEAASPRKEPSPTPLKTAPVGIAAPIPISEKQYRPPSREPPTQGFGASTEKHPSSNPETSSAAREGRKRKRFAGEEEEAEDETVVDVQNQLIGILERNGRMVAAQLEAQNTNFQLDREQRRDHADSLVGVLNKLADALGKIADKL